MNFIRIFNNFNALWSMLPPVKAIPMKKSSIIRYIAFGALVVVASGCQKLFTAQDAPLKGQTVTVSVTVPDQPPPSAKPLQQPVEQVGSSKQPAKAALDSRLLPSEVASSDPLAARPVSKTVQPKPPKPVRAPLLKADTLLSGKTVVEDAVWRGSVLVQGAVVIAPQATVRIEPGTIIRFAPAVGSDELPRLVVQGRIMANGTVQQPIVFAPALTEPYAGDWGGVVLLNSEKKNSFDNCRIEGTQTGIEAHFSRFSAKGLVVVKSQTGVALYDSEASIQGASLSRCDQGIRLSDSELDLRDSTVRENRQGIVAERSSCALANVRVAANSQEGMIAEQCRFRLSNSLFSDNRLGIRLSGGDGQMLLCRFQQNRENGAELVGVKARISNAAFVQNNGFGLMLDGARGMVVGSVFSENKAGNLLHQGGIGFAALLNWWGTADERKIAAGIIDKGRIADEAPVLFSPFLKDRPATVP